MAQRIEENYSVEPGAHGSAVIVVSGRCDGSRATIDQIEGGCSVGELVKIPHARGVVFKAFDGSKPAVFYVRPPTMERTYRCVKLYGKARPFAAQQSGGVFDGETVLLYEIRYQQIGDPEA